MDVIINNPAPAAPVAPQYFPTQGYGYAPSGPSPYRDHDGPGFGGVLLFVLGGFLLLRFLRFRRFGGRRMRFAGPGGPPFGPKDGPREDGEAGEGDRFTDFWRRGRDSFVTDRALDIARERLAKGEIGPEDYETIRAALQRTE